MSKDFLTDAYKKLQQRLQQGFSHSGAGGPRSMFWNRRTGEDALGDAFCRLWAGGYDPSTEEEGEKLLFASLRHRQVSLWRMEQRHPQTSLENIQIAEPTHNTDIEDTYRQIRELIRTQLTPLQQDILTRHDIQGEQYSEIAQRLDMQEAAVRMQLSRARRIIRETYRKLKVKSDK